MQDEQRRGWAFGIVAYSIWGSFPLYFHFLREVDATQVIAHRIVWSVVFCVLLITLLKRWERAKAALFNRRLLFTLMGSSALVGVNWLIFVAAVGRGEVLACSLGYFLTPLVSVLLAALFLKERLDGYQKAATALAIIGVLYFVLQLGVVPWVSLSLAITFGLYGLVRKTTVVGPLSGLFVETLCMAPISMAFLIWCFSQGNSQFLQQGGQSALLLIGSGILTALPLLAFAAAAQRLSLTVVGFMMYLNPILQFATAVFILREPYNMDQLVTFAIIFAALSVFSFGTLKNARQRRGEAQAS